MEHELIEAYVELPYELIIEVTDADTEDDPSTPVTPVDGENDETETPTDSTAPTNDECTLDPTIVGCDEVLNPSPTPEECLAGLNDVRCADLTEPELTPAPTTEVCEASPFTEGCPNAEQCALALEDRPKFGCLTT